MAKATEQAIRIKDDLLSAYPIEEDLVPGVWGTQLSISRGIAMAWPDDDVMSVPRLRREASKRLAYATVPISLPDRDLVAGLAALSFTNMDAERMPTKEFYRDIFPEVRDVVNRVTHPQVVFT